MPISMTNASLAKLYPESKVEELAQQELKDKIFIINDYTEDVSRYLIKGYMLGWPQGTKYVSARDLAINGTFGVYKKKESVDNGV